MTSGTPSSDLDLRPLVRRVWARRGAVLAATVVAGVLGATVEGEVDRANEGNEYLALAYSPEPEA